MISNVVPGLKGFANAVTGITQNYNRFTSKLVNVRSAIRSFGTLMGRTVHGIGPMVRSEMGALATTVKTGVTKAMTFLRGINYAAIWGRFKTGLDRGAAIAASGMRKIGAAFKTGFGKLHQFLLNSNNAFLKGIGSSISKIQNTIGNIRGISALGAKIQGLTANVPGLGKLTSSFSAFGVGAVVALGAVVIGIIAVIKVIGALVTKIKKSTEDFLNFERGMKGVQRVTLASAEDMKKLEEAAIKAGEASVFGVKDAAEAEKFLAQAGLKTLEIIEALPGTLELAAAANIELGRASDIATDIMAAQGLQAKDLTRINDTLVVSANNATTTVEGLAEGFSTVGAQGYLAGLEIEQMGAAIALLQGQGAKGALAGTLFRNMLSDLKSTAFKKAATAAGVDMAKFVNKATGEFVDFDGMIKEFGKLDKVARNTLLTTGFSDQSRGKRAFSGLILGAEQYAEAIDKVLTGSGTAAAAAEISFQGLDGAIKEYKSKMEAANVSFMKDSGLNDLFEEFARFGSATLPEIWRSLGLILKPFVKILTVAMKVIRVIFTFLGGMLKVFNRIFGAFLSIMDTGLKPILDAIDQMSSGIKKAFDLLSDLEEGPLQWVKTIFDLIGKIVAGIVKGLLFLLGPLLFVVDVLLNLFLIILPNAFNNFFSFMEDKLKNSFIGKEGASVGDFFGNLFGGEGDTPNNFAGVNSPLPNVVNGGSSSKNSVGKIEANVTIQGGVTNEDTAATMSEAMKDILAEELRFLDQEVD
jgi:TP901 family phage tail tape measure protein